MIRIGTQHARRKPIAHTSVVLPRNIRGITHNSVNWTVEPVVVLRSESARVQVSSTRIVEPGCGAVPEYSDAAILEHARLVRRGLHTEQR